jgi:leader peptidase (prepilin peptidase) / N-methyltransferase
MNHFLYLDQDLMGVLLLTGSVILGLCVGSFLGMLVHRLPIMMVAQWKELPAPLSLVRPRSHCPACGHVLAWWENIPLLSQLVLLKGRCRSCGIRIPALYPCVEALAAVVSLVTAWRLGVAWQTMWAIGLVWALVGLSWIDAREHLLPDVMTLPLLWIGLLVNLSGVFVSLSDAVLGAVAGYVSLWSVFWVFKLLTGKEAMGYGDFKLLAALGAWLGWMAVAWIFLLAFAASAVFGVVVSLRHREGGLDRAMPFGPFLAAAAWIVLLLGLDPSNTCRVLESCSTLWGA